MKTLYGTGFLIDMIFSCVYEIFIYYPLAWRQAAQSSFLFID